MDTNPKPDEINQSTYAAVTAAVRQTIPQYSLFDNDSLPKLTADEPAGVTRLQLQILVDSCVRLIRASQANVWHVEVPEWAVVRLARQVEHLCGLAHDEMLNQMQKTPGQAQAEYDAEVARQQNES